ncbi:hypothetical protein ACF0H5_000468 [Mactra antiquata]
MFTFCRRIFLGQRSSLRIFSTYSTKASRKAKLRKETIHVPYENAKEIVLNFFNKCDRVTLQKLIRSKSSLFKEHNFSSLHKSVVELSDRFNSIDDFVDKYGVTQKNIENMAQSILELQEKEKNSFGMSGIHPNFSHKGKKNMDKVMVLNLFRTTVSWCVRSTVDHSVLQLGVENLDIPDNYDHMKYQPQISTFLRNLPISDVYLVHAMSKRNKGRQLTYFHLQQAILEAVFVTLLNEKHSNIKEPSLYPGSINSKDDESEMAKKYFRTNRVYLWDLASLREFYEVTFKDDQLSTSSIVKDLYNERPSVINYWKMDNKEFKDMFYDDGSESLSLCVLMSDAFCRCLKKSDHDFPSAYSTHTKIV